MPTSASPAAPAVSAVTAAVSAAKAGAGPRADSFSAQPASASGSVSSVAKARDLGDSLWGDLHGVT
jgi:hypothetical protein